ncbi:MAG: hypothetical protein H6626_09175 [Pseudobdellovibrionaceae bacterium]|nr:hypothetical protein [Bdellovibrionales bacterium]USN46387.1 MAG: hypothetical protein H6626_09175 [Pseudobdellovibrionaceae bacterium]
MRENRIKLEELKKAHSRFWKAGAIRKANSKGMSIVELLVVIGVMTIVISGTSLLILNTQKSVNFLNSKFDQLSTMADISARLKDSAQCSSVFSGTQLTNLSNTADDAQLETVSIQGKVLGGIALDNFISGGIKISGIDLKLVSSAPPELTHRAFFYFHRKDGRDVTPPLAAKYLIVKSQVDGANTITSCVGLGGELDAGDGNGVGPFGGGSYNGLVTSVRQAQGDLQPVGSVHGFVVEAKIENGLPHVRYRQQFNMPFSDWEQTDLKNIGPTMGHIYHIAIRVTVAGLMVRGPTFMPNCGHYSVFQTFSPWGTSIPLPAYSSVTQGFGSIECSGGQ